MVLGLGSCQQASQSQTSATKPAQVSACINKSTAEKIMGQSAKLTQNSTERKPMLMSYKCTYTALQPDAKSNRPIALYYQFDAYDTEAEASKTYKGILESNRQMEGLKILEGFGDEAYSHSDKQNFCMVIARKGSKLLRIKLNKLTEKSSVAELERIAKIVINNS